jgi:2'-5' RNA ligase
MRLFIAINFKEETRLRLLALRDELHSRSERGNFSALENLHLTLGREVVTDRKLWTIEPFGEMVSSIELMKSERISGKLTYSAIETRRAIK